MCGMSTHTKRWPSNPPEPEPIPPDPELFGLEDGPFDPSPVQASSPAQRAEQARASAHRRLPPDAQSLRYSPILWISVITLTILGLSGLILWHEWRNPRPAPMATPAGVTDDGGRQAGLTMGGAGPATVEVYIDFMCTQCRAVDAQTKPMLDTLVAQNRIRLVWHPIGALDDRTEPPGYASRAANALACAADAGENKARAFAEAMFAAAPAAGSAGLSDDDILDLAGPVGLNAPSFAACVRDEHYADWVAAGGRSAAQRGVSQVPAVFVNGRQVANTPAAILAALG